MENTEINIIRAMRNITVLIMVNNLNNKIYSLCIIHAASISEQTNFDRKISNCIGKLVKLFTPNVVDMFLSRKHESQANLFSRSPIPMPSFYLDINRILWCVLFDIIYKHSEAREKRKNFSSYIGILLFTNAANICDISFCCVIGCMIISSD